MSMLLLGSGFTDVRPGLIFWTLVTFIVVAFVLRAKAWKPILAVVEEREKQITNAIESAKRERAEAEKMLAEQRTMAEAARREAAENLRKSQAELEKFREELMAKSRKEAEELKLEAQRTITEAKAKAVAELKGESVSLAIQIAEKLLNEKLDDAKHRTLAEQFIAELPRPGATRPSVQ